MMRLRLPPVRLRGLAAIARDERGASLIEFGFLAPVLAFLVMGVIDLSRGLSERFSLQQAVNRSLELVQARPAYTDSDSNAIDYTYVKTEAQTVAGTTATVVVSKWRECDGVEATPYNGTCPDRANGTAPDTARYLRVRITKNFQGQFYFGTIPMAASGALRIQ